MRFSHVSNKLCISGKSVKNEVKRCEKCLDKGVFLLQNILTDCERLISIPAKRG